MVESHLRILKEKMIEETFLDLRKVTVFGRERYKSDLAVDSLVRAIEAGGNLPIVQIYERTDGNYQLTDGHTRTVASFIANRPLRVQIIKREKKVRPKKLYFDIRETILVDDELIDKDGNYRDEKGVVHTDIASYQYLKELDPNYR